MFSLQLTFTYSDCVNKLFWNEVYIREIRSNECKIVRTNSPDYTFICSKLTGKLLYSLYQIINDRPHLVNEILIDNIDTSDIPDMISYPKLENKIRLETIGALLNEDSVKEYRFYINNDMVLEFKALSAGLICSKNKDYVCIYYCDEYADSSFYCLYSLVFDKITLVKKLQNENYVPHCATFITYPYDIKSHHASVDEKLAHPQVPVVFCERFPMLETSSKELLMFNHEHNYMSFMDMNGNIIYSTPENWRLMNEIIKLNDDILMIKYNNTALMAGNGVQIISLQKLFKPYYAWENSKDTYEYGVNSFNFEIIKLENNSITCNEINYTFEEFERIVNIPGDIWLTISDEHYEKNSNVHANNS